MSLLSTHITTTRGRLLAAFALCIALIAAPSAFGKKSAVDLMRSALHISNRADKNANLPLKPVDSKRIKDGAVATVDLADGAVNGAKLADDSVTTSKIANGNVTNDDLADGAIGSSKVADESLTGADIADATIGSPE